MQEIKKLDDAAAVFVIDNDKNKDILALNTAFADLFETLLQLPEIADAKGSIDGADIKRALESTGAAEITKIPQDQSSVNALIESFHNSIFAPIERDEVVEHIVLSTSTGIDVNEFNYYRLKPVDCLNG